MTMDSEMSVAKWTTVITRKYSNDLTVVWYFVIINWYDLFYYWHYWETDQKHCTQYYWIPIDCEGKASIIYYWLLLLLLYTFCSTEKRSEDEMDQSEVVDEILVSNNNGRRKKQLNDMVANEEWKQCRLSKCRTKWKWNETWKRWWNEVMNSSNSESQQWQWQWMLMTKLSDEVKKKSGWNY